MIYILYRHIIVTFSWREKRCHYLGILPLFRNLDFASKVSTLVLGFDCHRVHPLAWEWSLIFGRKFSIFQMKLKMNIFKNCVVKWKFKKWKLIFSRNLSRARHFDIFVRVKRMSLFWSLKYRMGWKNYT